MYATKSEIDDFSNDIGATQWPGLSDDVKTKAMDQALYDMIEQHGQHNSDGEAWLQDDLLLIEAYKRQCIYVSTKLNYRNIADNTRELSQGVHSDSNITAMPGVRRLDPIAASLINEVIRTSVELGIIENGFAFDRPYGNRFAR